MFAQLSIGDQLPCRGRSPVAFRVSGIPYSARVPLFKIGHFASRTRWLPCLAPNFAIWPWALSSSLPLFRLRLGHGFRARLDSSGSSRIPTDSHGSQVMIFLEVLRVAVRSVALNSDLARATMPWCPLISGAFPLAMQS